MNVIERARTASATASAKVASVVALAAAGASAQAQDAGSMGAQIVTKVEGAMTQGELIAGAVVLGLFAIWAIKLLFRAK